MSSEKDGVSQTSNYRKNSAYSHRHFLSFKKSLLEPTAPESIFLLETTAPESILGLLPSFCKTEQNLTKWAWTALCHSISTVGKGRLWLCGTYQTQDGYWGVRPSIQCLPPTRLRRTTHSKNHLVMLVLVPSILWTDFLETVHIFDKAKSSTG